MAVYVNGEQTDTFVISGEYSIGEYSLPAIDVINSEPFSVDLDELVIENNGQKLEIIKVSVQIDDKEVVTSTPSIDLRASSIQTTTSDSFKTVTINASFNEDESSGTLTVIAYDASGSSVVFKIPYNVLFKSISEYGSEFDLLQANITNSDAVSYVLSHRKENAVLFVRSL